MYNDDSIYTDMNLFSSSNRLFAFNDQSNIWSSEKMIPIDFNKPKMLMNNATPFNLQDRFARNRKPPGDRRDTNLIVNYLPDGFYEKELFDLFSQAGSIVHHHVVRNKDNRSECYGFVDFEKASDAEKAIEMFHQFSIQNKKLKVQNAAEGLQIKEEERHRALKCITNVGYNVEIKNAPMRWTVNDVKNVFGKYGELLKVYESINDENEIVTELKTKTFNIVYRYHTIAMKVVKKKNKTPAEALWPLELELSIVGQEIIETPVDTLRTRTRTHKPKVDAMSDSSWETKLENKLDNSNTIYYQKNFENPINYWTDMNSEYNKVCGPFTVNGRPILKHKDNLMHSGNSFYEPSINSDLSDKWNNPLNDASNSFFENMQGSCNDIKAIWAPKEIVNHDLIPHDIYIKTPLIPSRHRRDETRKYHANIWYKMENMQPTGSFKLRGMAYLCYKAKLDGVQTIVSSSGGNAGLAAAYASRLLKMKCIVFVPLTTPVSIISELLKENAEVIQEGNNWKEAHIKAENCANLTPRSQLVHPFDNPLLWIGYETIVDEIVAEMKDMRVDMIVLSVGGGGLLNGIAQGISKNKMCKTTAMLALETEGCASFHRSVSANHVVSIVPNSVATSLGASMVSQRTWEIYCSMEYHLFSKICTDQDAVESCYQFLHEQNCLVEPACGATLSAVYNGTLDKMAECRNSDLNIVVIVCGGRCMDIAGLFETRHNLSLLDVHTHQPMPSNYDVYNMQDQFTTLDLNNKDCYLLAPTIGTADTDRVYNQSPATANTAAGTQSFTRPRNYASVLGDMTVTARNTNHSYHQQQYTSMDNNNYDDVQSPVGSQHSDKENRMLHH